MSLDTVINQHPIAHFYQAHHAWLHAWLKKKLGCSDTAADIAQDTIIKVIYQSDFAKILEPRAYLTTTATRIVIDNVRKQKVEQAYLNAIALHQVDHTPSPEQISLAIASLNEIAAMLQGLPENVYRAFLMYRLDGMRQTEIATELGVSTCMVKQYIARAMLQCCMFEA